MTMMRERCLPLQPHPGWARAVLQHNHTQIHWRVWRSYNNYYSKINVFNKVIIHLLPHNVIIYTYNKESDKCTCKLS